MPKKLTPLIPPDLKQCQAETHEYRPFIMGGNVNTITRCTNKPVFLAQENRPGKDGRRGSMSLCAKCAVAMEKQLGPEFSTLTKIKSSKRP